MNQNKKNIVSIITISRLIGIPFLLVINNDYYLLAAAAILFFTDFLDGYFARKWEVESLSGALLDLVADKSLVITLLLYGVVDNKIGIVLFILIAFREIYSMVIRFKGLKQKKEMISASLIGKSKTALQFIAILFMIINLDGYKLLLWISVGLSYYSFIGYLKQYKGVQ